MTDPITPGERPEPRDERWYERTRYQILLFAGGIAIFILVIGLVLDWYIGPRTSTEKKDLVQALGLITAGVAGAVGIFFTWRGQRLAREAQEANQKNTLTQLENAQEQLKLARRSQEDDQSNTQEQLELTRRGQITERFTQAIDQLGNDSLSIRLGGIYSLERTAREDRDYYWPIMEVLMTYVQQHSPGKPEEDWGEEVPFPVPHPEPDIQAILAVIGRRSVYSEDVEHGSIALPETSLQGAMLQGTDFRRTNFNFADLQGVYFEKAGLQEAALWRANLKYATLASANLREANLTGADLSQANLSHADLSHAHLGHANLKEANLSHADLSEARGWTDEQLSEARSLEGATMPNGETYEEWLKNKEGRGKGVENE